MGNSATGGNTAAFGLASDTSPGMVSTGAQTFGGVKTFTQTIVGSVSGASGAVANGVYTTGDQTIAGVKTFTDGVLGPGSVPIGCMVVAMPNIDAVNSWQPPATSVIKDGFMRADGTTITAGHVSQGCKLAVGTVLPNMIQKYPRGNTTSGTTGGANTVTIASANLPTHTHGSGTLANAAEAAHTHGVGTYANAAEAAHTHASALPSHRHFIKSRGTSASGATDSFGQAYTRLQTNLFYGPLPTAGSGVGIQEAGTHSHSWGGHWSNDGSSTVASPEGDGSGNTYEDGVGYWGVGGTRTTSAGSSHNHTFSGTSAAGSSHNHTISGSTDNGGFANTSLNNEPAYVEVVWVIRVK